MPSKSWKISRYDFFFPSVLRSSSVKEQSWISELMNAVSSLALSAEALSVTSCPSRLSFFLWLSPSHCLLLQGVMCHYLLIRSRVSGLWLIWNAFGGSMFSDLTSCFNQAIISSHPLQQTERLSVSECFFFFFSGLHIHTHTCTTEPEHGPGSQLVTRSLSDKCNRLIFWSDTCGIWEVWYHQLKLNDLISRMVAIYLAYFFKVRVWNIFVLPYILSLQQLYPYIDVLQLAV